MENIQSKEELISRIGLKNNLTQFKNQSKIVFKSTKFQIKQINQQLLCSA